VSGGKTHTEQLVMGHMDILGRFCSYFRGSYLYYITADYWELESWRIWECNLLWDRGEAVCVTEARKGWQRLR
jgi:hypothetical protein